MPRSSRHKSYKHSKHSSKDYSDSEEDVIKVKEKSSGSKDENTGRAHRDEASGEKRKIMREGKDGKDLGANGNGEVLEEYLSSSKRRKENSDVIVVGDRWSGGGGGGGDERVDSDRRNVEKEMHKGESLYKLQGSSNKVKTRIESKNKTHGSERKEDSLAAVGMEKEESKSKGEPKWKSDRDSSAHKEGNESKGNDQDRKSDKEKNVVQGGKSGDERTGLDDLRNQELEKEIEKEVRKRREGSNGTDKHHDYSKESNEKRLSVRGDRAKDLKHKDYKHKDENYADKYQDENGHKEDKRRDEKYRKEADKDSKLRDDKYRDDREKKARSRDDRHREDVDRSSKHKDEKNCEEGERDSRRKDDKYRETVERDGRRDDKYHEDDVKDLRRGDERYYEDEDGDDRRRDNTYRDDGDRDTRKEEKFREDIERDIRHKDSKQGYSRDDGYAGDYQSRKSSAYYDSPPRDDRTGRYRDDQDRRRKNEKADYGDIRSKGTWDKNNDAEKKSISSATVDLVAERVRPTSRNTEIEPSFSHSRRRSSPTSSSHAPRDHYRVLKQDESKYKDYNHEERVRHNLNSSGDYTGAIGGSEKTTSTRSLEKVGVKHDGHLGEVYTERRLKSDIRSSPLQLVDKSPSSSSDRTQLGKRDVRRSIAVEESTPRTGGSRDVLPGDERLQADTDTLSVSSPFVRNSHFSGSSKSFRPPPPFRTGVESPHHHRRISDPNMGRIQGNMWRGVPNWTSSVGNVFLPFPHAPPPVGFGSVMQPFPPPPFGVRPLMELNHPSYLGRPMGWRNQVDNSYPPFHSWDASNAVFGDYGRSDWEQSRSGQGWETSGEYSKGPNSIASLEMPSSERANRSADETLADQSTIPSADAEQTPDDKQAEFSDASLLTKNSEKNDVDAPFISFGEASNVAKLLKKGDVCLSHFYLLKIDISADLTESELCDKCTCMIDLDPSDVDDAKNLVMEEAVEAKMASHKRSSCTMFASTDDFVFQKSMSLYKRQKGNIWNEYGEKHEVLSEFIAIADQNEDDKSKKLDMQGFKDPENSLQIDLPVYNIMEKSKELGSASNQENDVEEKPLSTLPLEVDDASNSEEQKLVDTKYGNLLNTVVSSESVNLSRIHHSPESTH